jgi:hypothetical protein
VKRKPKVLPLARIRAAQNAASLAASILATIVRQDDTGEQLAIAVAALRSIVSMTDQAMNRSKRVRGIARGALKRIGA